MDKIEVQKIVFSLLIQSGQVVIQPESYSELCNFIHKNKISFIRINKNKHKCPVFIESDIFKSYLIKEENLYRQWVDDFEDVKVAWEKENIDYIFHKSIGQFPYQSDNLDMLVKTSDFKRAGESLRSINYVNLRNIQEAHKEFYRKFDGKIAKGPIHLHERVCWVVPYDNIEHIWENKQQSLTEPSVYYLNPNDALITQAIHCFIEDHVIKAKDLIFIKEIIEDSKLDWDYIITTAKNNYFDHALFTSFIIVEYLHKSIYGNNLFPEKIMRESWEFVQTKSWINRKLKNILSSSPILPFYLPHLWSRFHSSIREFIDPSFGSKFRRFYQVFGGLIDRLIHLKLKFHNQPSMHIAFSGMDGSGKSTFIDHLTSNFADCDIKTKVVWHRPGSMGITKLFLNGRRKIAHKACNSIKSTPSTDKKEIKRNKSKIENFLYRLLYFIDMQFYNISLRYNLMHGKVVIADRYLLDDMVDIESLNNKPKFDRLSYWLLKKSLPKPKIHYLIYADTKEIRKRSNEEILEDLNLYETLYNEVKQQFNVTIINNSLEFTKVYNALSHNVLNTYFSLFPQKFSGYIVKSYIYK